MTDGDLWLHGRALETRQGREYAEWVLLVADLQFSLERVQMWEGMASSDSTDPQNQKAAVSVLRDGVVTFVSCFDPEAPMSLVPAVVYGEVAGGVEYFEWLKDVRNTWIAHRGGPHRQCVTVAIVDEQSGDLVGVGHLAHLYQGPKPDAAGDLIKVIKMALSHANGELRRRQISVRKELEAMGEEARRRLRRANTTIPGSSEIRLGRRRFRERAITRRK